jgi:hypothetical protein
MGAGREVGRYGGAHVPAARNCDEQSHTPVMNDNQEDRRGEVSHMTWFCSPRETRPHTVATSELSGEETTTFPLRTEGGTPRSKKAPHSHRFTRKSIHARKKTEIQVAAAVPRESRMALAVDSEVGDEHDSLVPPGRGGTYMRAMEALG